MSLQTEYTSSSPLKKRRRSSSSSVDENERNSKHLHSHQPSLVALPPPMISNPDKPSSLPTPGPSPAAPPSSSGVAYYPIYTAHPGHFYLASPPLHPSSPSHPTKILPKLPNTHHQAPPTPATLPSSPPSLPYTFYHPYQISPPIQPTTPTAYHHHHHSTTTTTTADQREQARKVCSGSSTLYIYIRHCILNFIYLFSNHTVP